MKFEICLFFIYLGAYGATSIDNPIASQIDKSSVSPLRVWETERERARETGRVMAVRAPLHLLPLRCSATKEDQSEYRDKSRNARVLVLGGTGRVGGSTAIALSKLRPDLHIIIAGRNRSNKHSLTPACFPRKSNCMNRWTEMLNCVNWVPWQGKRCFYGGYTRGQLWLCRGQHWQCKIPGDGFRGYVRVVIHIKRKTVLKLLTWNHRSFWHNCLNSRDGSVRIFINCLIFTIFHKAKLLEQLGI